MTTGTGDTANPTGQQGLGQEVFGPYVVYERLGVGGMATVHRAREHGIEGFERIVALKRLLPHLAEDASFVKSFVREAKLASMLRHANIVQLYELGRVGTTYFISMELIDGRDVRRILRQARKVTGPATINVTLSLLIQLSDALDYAHTRHDDDTGQPLHIVHRDVSPSNLLVTKSGHLKIIDFGIAKAQSSQLRTATGRVKGKLAYMAPEAIAGKELDARSDVFSAGVIAHELLTARPLFASKNEYQTLLKVQKGDILPPSTFNQACPPELDAVVLKALARDPDQRYSSAAEMRDALHEVRIRYHISATNREVSGWCEWAFSMEAPQNNFGGPMVTDSLSGGVSQSRSPLALPLPGDGDAQGRTPTGTARAVLPAPATERMSARSGSEAEDDVADVAWGGAQEPDSGQGVVLDDVPDHSARVPSVAGLAAAAAEQSNEWERAGRPTPSAQQRAVVPAKFPVGSSDDALSPRPRSGHHAAVAPVESHSDATERNERVEASSFGAGMLEGKKAEGNALRNLLIAAVVLGLVAVGAYVAFSGGTKKNAGTPGATAAQEKPVPEAAPMGKLKFIVEPKDAAVHIAGIPEGNGDGWTVEVDPGLLQVDISREGYKSWVTQIDLAPNEMQTVRVVLEKGGNPAVATLVVTSNPNGLVVLIDGVEVGNTPFNKEIAPGSHELAVRDSNGDIKWSKDVKATANTKFEFNADLNAIAEKQRQREAAAAAATRVAAVAPEKRRTAKTGGGEKIDLGSSTGSSYTPEATKVETVTPPPPPPPVVDEKKETEVVAPPVVEKKETVPPPPVKKAEPKPVMLKPGEVTRISGELGNLKADLKSGQEMPTSIAAKVCIDTAGKVTSVQVLKLTGELADTVKKKLKGFRYSPYKQNGVAVPACLFETFKFKYKGDGRDL
jgi:serine/threonine protein kinase